MLQIGMHYVIIYITMRLIPSMKRCHLEEPTKMVRKTEVLIMGEIFDVEIFARENGKGFALTRYATEDVIITDGRNVEDALQRHSAVLPLAIDCRSRKKMAAGRELHY
jgi:hypothetical protein